MRTIIVLIVLAVIVLSLVAVIAWPTLWTGATAWERVFLFAVDTLGVLWFAALIALGIASLRRGGDAAVPPTDSAVG